MDLNSLVGKYVIEADSSDINKNYFTLYRIDKVAYKANGTPMLISNDVLIRAPNSQYLFRGGIIGIDLPDFEISHYSQPRCFAPPGPNSIIIDPKDKNEFFDKLKEDLFVAMCDGIRTASNGLLSALREVLNRFELDAELKEMVNKDIVTKEWASQKPSIPDL